MRIMSLLTSLLLLVVAPVWADAAKFVEIAATPALLAEIQQGGFVLYMRHGNTNSKIPDRVPDVDINDCSTQRPLTDEGRRNADKVGEWFRKAGIPVAEVQASPMCRAKESAMLAFGRIDKLEYLLKYSSNMPSSAKKPALAYLREQLLKPVPAGSNRVIVAHAPNLMDLIGYFPTPETTVVVFRQTPQGFTYAASIHPDDWAALVPETK